MAFRFGDLKFEEIHEHIFQTLSVRSQREFGMGKSISAHKNADEVLFIIMVDRCHLVCNPRDTPKLHPQRTHLPSGNTDRVTTLPACLSVCRYARLSVSQLVSQSVSQSICLYVCPSFSSKTLQEFIDFLIIPSTI